MRLSGYVRGSVYRCSRIAVVSSLSVGAPAKICDGRQFWVGEDGGNAAVDVNAVFDDAEFRGIVQEGLTQYVIRPIGGRVHVKYRVNPKTLRDDHDPAHPSGGLADTVIELPEERPSSAVGQGLDALLPVTQSLLDNGAPYIKVLVVYTPAAAAFVQGNVGPRQNLPSSSRTSRTPRAVFNRRCC